jgi:hypothetical protein
MSLFIGHEPVLPGKTAKNFGLSPLSSNENPSQDKAVDTGHLLEAYYVDFP